MRYPRQKALFVFIFSIVFTRGIHAQKPLWTPEDVVNQPEVSAIGISNDGKYSLIHVYYPPLKEEAKEYSECIVINNEDLTQRKVGASGRSCGQPQLIGDGKTFSYITTDKDKNMYALFVQNILSGKESKVQEFPVASFYSYQFSPDGKNLAFTQITYPPANPRIIEGDSPKIRKSLFLQKFSSNFEPIGKSQELLPLQLNMYDPLGGTTYTWSPDSQKIAFTVSTSQWKGESKIGLYLITLNQNKIEKIDEEIGMLKFIAFSSQSQKIAYFKSPEENVQGISQRKPKGNRDEIIRVVDLSTDKKTLLSGDDVTGIVGWLEGDEQILVIKRARTKFVPCLLTMETAGLKCLDIPNLPSATGFSLSQNRKYLVFRGESLHYPSEFYISLLDSFKPKKITSFHRGLNLSKIQAHPLTWKSFDGLEIEGILVYPQDYQKGKKVPLIVSIHGGPRGFESERFIGSMWFGAYSPAVFSSLGYTTLAVNFRGSIGYGDLFKRLDYRDLGGGDFKDILVGVDYLIDQGIADPEQLFIRGQSYGGFMTAWAIGQTSRFKAASMEAGIVDWVSDSATTDTPEYLMGGLYWEDYSFYYEDSPLTYINNITTPTLILSGLRDPRVSPKQSQQFYQALKGRKVPTRLIYYPDEGHGFGDPLANIDAMKETIKWFHIHRKENHLPDK